MCPYDHVINELIPKFHVFHIIRIPPAESNIYTRLITLEGWVKPEEKR